MEPYIKLAVPDIVTRGLTDMDGGFITTQASDTVLESLPFFDALAIGPGLGGMATTRDFVIDILEDSKLPAVIDADGLNHLASCKDLERTSGVPWILTPHPGEAARLLDTTLSNVLSDPISAAQSLSDRYNAVVVLKGANTLTVNTDGTIFVNPTGNPGMATLGMGDVLTGIIASLLAAKVSPFNAAIAGVYIHGFAGDIAASSIGEESITSSDVIESVPKALVMIRQGLVHEKISTLR
jgi:NAD(P)H-hydrate epimerase